MASGFGVLGKVFPKKKPAAPKAEAIRLIGTVRLVNTEEKFILIDAVIYQAIAGETLITLADQRQTATLQLSPLRNPPFLIADIASGTPAVGQKVYKP